MQANTITSLENLTGSISADTEVCIPGYHLESTDNASEWILADDTDNSPVELITVRW